MSVQNPGGVPNTPHLKWGLLTWHDGRDKRPLAILGYRIARDAKLFSDLPLAFVLKQILLPNTIIVHNSDPHFDTFPFVELPLIQ